MAELHPQLKADCVYIGRFPLCHLLLMQDANYPWFILVPDRKDIRELHQLSESDQQQYIKESSALAKTLEREFHPDKLNIAALGNIVPQLHIHHVVRYQTDPAWPAPIWGKVSPVAYSKQELDDILNKLKRGLINDFEFKQ